MEGPEPHFGGQDAGESRYSSIRDYLRVVRRYRVFIVVITLLVTGGAIAYSASQDPVYRSDSSLAFSEPTEDIELIGLQNTITSTPEQRAAVGAEEANGRGILAAARRRLGLRESVSALDDDVNARAETQTNLVVVEARAHTPRRAARLSGAVSREVIRVGNADQRRRYNKLIRAIRREQRTSLKGKDPATQFQRLALARNLVQLRSTRDFSAPVKLVEPPSLPTSSIEPKTTRNVIVGFLAGLVLGLLLAFLRAALDRRLRGSEGLDEKHPPVLAVVRKKALGKTSVTAVEAGNADAEVDLEAARILRTNLEFLRPDQELGTVLVTSPLPDEGKSTVAVNLAAAVALTGKQVLLLECDLRRPVLAERLGIDAAPGLSEFLLGSVGSRDALQTVALPSQGAANGSGSAASGGTGAPAPLLTCMTAGTAPPKLTELLATQSFSDFLSTVARAYDAVIIDSGPVLPSVDTLQLVSSADVIALCVRSSQTTREELRSTLEAIGRVGRQPVGLVITGAVPADEGDYGHYSYRYAQTRS